MDITSLIKSALPFIGTALGGPLGGGVTSFIASKLGVDETSVVSTLNGMLGNPEHIAKAKQLELDYQAHCLELGYQSIKDLEAINASMVIEVNKTMQTEAGSEHWQTYSWRPAIGFAVAFNVVMSSLIVLITYAAAIFGSQYAAPAMANLPSIIGTLAAISGTVMPILGIASYFRGKMQADPSIPPLNTVK